MDNEFWDKLGFGPQFLDTSAESVTEEEILDYLARIIASIYLKKRTTQQQAEKEDPELSAPSK